MNAELIFTIAAIITALAVIGKALRVAYVAMRKLEILDTIASEFEPNHGSSLRDSIDGITKDISEIRTELTEVKEDVGFIKKNSGDRVTS